MPPPNYSFQHWGCSQWRLRNVASGIAVLSSPKCPQRTGMYECLPRWFDVYLRGHIEDAHGAAHAIWPVIAIAIGILF